MTTVTKVVFPERIRTEARFPFGEVVTLTVPEGTFVTTPAGTEKLPEQEAMPLRVARLQSQIYLLKLISQSPVESSTARAKRVSGSIVQDVSLTLEGVDIVLSIDTKLARIQEIGYVDPSDPTKRIKVTYSNFRRFDGLTLPGSLKGSIDGNVKFRADVTSFRTNVALEDALFIPPETGHGP